MTGLQRHGHDMAKNARSVLGLFGVAIAFLGIATGLASAIIFGAACVITALLVNYWLWLTRPAHGGESEPEAGDQP